MQRQKQRECNTQALEYSSMDRNRENTTHTAAWTETERIQHTQQHGQKQREYNTHSSMDRNRENTTHTAAWTETERIQHTRVRIQQHRQKQREYNTHALEYSSIDRNRENATHTR